MTEEEALTLAILCFNDSLDPNATDKEDRHRLSEGNIEEALEVLDKMRASLRGDPPTGKHHRK